MLLGRPARGRGYGVRALVGGILKRGQASKVRDAAVAVTYRHDPSQCLSIVACMSSDPFAVLQTTVAEVLAAMIACGLMTA